MNNKNKTLVPKEIVMIKYITMVMSGSILIVLSFLLLKEDFWPFISWWMVLMVLGISFLPLTFRMFSSFHDNGYLFSKTIAIAVTGYIMWLLSSIRLLKFNSFSCLLVVFLCLGVNIFIYIKTTAKDKKSILMAEKRDTMIKEELLFLAFFLLWTYIRGFKPEAYGTEKFMDYGFMTALMRADYMPPKDLWFAGSSINYYYVGQYMATFLTKLSFVKVSIGYNLMLMSLAAFSFVLPYSLIFNITKNYFNNNKIKHKKTPVVAGVLSGAGVSIASNMHFPLYYKVIPILQTLLRVDNDENHYWFPDSTRYIGYDPETTDKTIHEFPGYSFILGDLHAHVINIIFVLTLLGILFGWLMYRKKKMEVLTGTNAVVKPNILKEVCNPYILIIGFFIGLFHMTNFWDFPIYYVVAGAVILFSNLVFYQFRAFAYRLTALQGVLVIVVAEITALPFTLNFDQISTEIRLATAHTPFYQLIILWGLPITLIIGLIIELLMHHKQVNSSRSLSNQDQLKKAVEPKFFHSFLSSLNISDMFIVILGLCAIGLVLIPEIIYVKDIYSGDFKRANTMFKLTYQAFIMFGLCMGFIFAKFFKNHRFVWQRKFLIFTLILFLSSTWYPVVSVKAWYGNIFNSIGYKGLDATAFLETEFAGDYLAINWLNENVKGTPVVLEANGDSYSDYERVSMATGLPTVLGWYVHEWLWRGDTSVLEERTVDIETIYTTDNMEQVYSLIEKYDIEYIYVGGLEQDKYSDLNHELLKKLGTIVYMNPNTTENSYETYIVQIDPKG